MNKLTNILNGGFFVEYPTIFLAIDNCFASKRWTSPNEWCSIIKESGINFIEASADNECDPLFTVPSYINDWLKEVKFSCEKNNIDVLNFYSGHGTYAMTGLANPDERIRNHIANNWIQPYIKMASELKAGVGFFCHAFPNVVLQNSDIYLNEVKKLENTLMEIRDFASLISDKTISLEQMYSPHQYPWTIETAIDFIQGTGIYITLDTGHQVGQRLFLKPTSEELNETLTPSGHDIWTGTDYSYDLVKKARCGELNLKEAYKLIEEDINKNPHLFSRQEDCSLYQWTKEIGCYCPIIHLQQNNGLSSTHWSFTEEKNKIGIVEPQKLLESLIESYQNEELPGMPPRCKEITLTLELFFDTAEYPFYIRSQLLESVEYWRKFIPEDGMRLNELPCLKEYVKLVE